MQEVINDIKSQFEYHKSKVNEEYAVLKPISIYTNIDWGYIMHILEPLEINAYTMTDKIVIKRKNENLEGV